MLAVALHHDDQRDGDGPSVLTGDLDRNGLEVLDREECLGLLAGATVGRVGISTDALPAILPVNYALDGEQIVIRTPPGGKLLAALARTVVAFEIDGFDPASHTGWSVLARGVATEVVDPPTLERLAELPLRPWATGAADHFVTIDPALITGRRIRGWYGAGVTGR